MPSQLSKSSVTFFTKRFVSYWNVFKFQFSADIFWPSLYMLKLKTEHENKT